MACGRPQFNDMNPTAYLRNTLGKNADGHPISGIATNSCRGRTRHGGAKGASG
jgi:hypothetical protein